MNRIAIQRLLNCFFILVVMGVVSGAIAFEFLEHENPCPLCFLQRLGMVGAACGAFLNLRFGIHARHYAISIFSALVGGAVSLRQITLHICPQFSTFGTPIMGLSLFTWAGVVALCSLIAIGIALLIYEPETKDTPFTKMNLLEKFVSVFLTLIVLANVVLAFKICGFGPCAG